MVKVTFQYWISYLYPEDEDEDETIYKIRNFILNTCASGTITKISPLNSLVVLEETTEEGRLFHNGIFSGKKEFLRASL